MLTHNPDDGWEMLVDLFHQIVEQQQLERDDLSGGRNAFVGSRTPLEVHLAHVAPMFLRDGSWLDHCLHQVLFDCPHPRIPGEKKTTYIQLIFNLKPPFHYAVLATICQFLQVGQDRVQWSRYGPWFSKVPDEKISSFQLPIVMKSYRSVTNRAAQCLVRVIEACQTSIRSSHCVYAIITLFPLALRLIFIGKIGEKFWTCSNFSPIWRNSRSYPFSQRPDRHSGMGALGISTCWQQCTKYFLFGINS